MNWAFCDGSLQQIADNEAMFNLIGTTYGGDGQSTFALPDLRGRLPVHMGTLSGGGTYSLGQMSGSETVALTTSTIPVHNHIVESGTTGDKNTPTGNVPGAWSEGLQYASSAPTAPMSTQAIGGSGGSVPHENMPPFLCISFIIALYGVFPSQ
jgi:microcystin-dependent protein